MLAQYGVSRESLREGLRRLEVQGLISIRRGPGGGPVVGIVDPANLGRISTLYFQMAGATYAELFEGWTLAESEMAERAARNPDGDARAPAMAPYLAARHPDPTRRSSNVRRAAHGFPRRHGRLAGNRVLELTLQTFGQIVSHHLATVTTPARSGRCSPRTTTRGSRRRRRSPAAGPQADAGAHRGLAAYHRERLGDRVDDFIEWL